MGKKRAHFTPKGAPLKFLLAALAANTDDCILWPFSKSQGYGKLYIDGKLVQAHREVCTRKFGPPPTVDHVAAHSCRSGQKGCVNHRHVRWATQLENMHDKLTDGTLPLGSKCYQARLTEAQVADVRRLIRQGETVPSVARIYGVSDGAVQAVKDRRSWRHVA